MMTNPLRPYHDSLSGLSQKTRKRYNRIAPFYDLMEHFTEKAVFRLMRKMLWAQIKPGKVLEVGVGTGKNIPYYSSMLAVTAIDISEKMMSFAQNRASELAKDIEFQAKDVQTLDFLDDSYDTAVATFVFCSVPDPVAGLRELGRVVKPNGDIWLLDHVRINKPIIGFLMDFLNPIVVRIMGANINRKTVENVKEAGLSIVSVKNLRGEFVKLIHANPGPNPEPRN